MNLLFICSRNKWRSRTAETIFKDRHGFQVRSAGTEPSARIKVNQKLIDWAEMIFVMEKKHRQRLQKNFTLDPDAEVIVLDIPDEYQYMDPELIEILESSVMNYFESDN